jgi:hypothetical protein
MAAFELRAGYDEDPILICFDNDGNMDLFHMIIIRYSCINSFLLPGTPVSILRFPWTYPNHQASGFHRDSLLTLDKAIRNAKVRGFIERG